MIVFENDKYIRCFYPLHNSYENLICKLSGICAGLVSRPALINILQTGAQSKQLCFDDAREKAI